MSILDTVLRRRDPPVKYRTVDGGHPAPYPDMTDEQLYNYEMTFNVPKKTFDQPPAHALTEGIGRTEPHSREDVKEHVTLANVPRTSTNGPRTASPKTSVPRPGSSRTTASRPTQLRPTGPHRPTDKQQEETTMMRSTREPVMPEDVPKTPPASLVPRTPRPLDLSKPVRTVTTKQPVEIVTTKARHPVFKVLGYIGEDQVVTMFTLDGQISENGPGFLENLPQKQSLYLNIYPNRTMGGRERFLLTQHETREAADAAATVERITCVPVEFDL